MFKDFIMDNSDLKIVVIYHKKYPTHPGLLFEPNLYVPILGGHAVFGIKPFIKGMLTDDVGDNISWANPYLNEVTSMYWIWKHPEAIGNPKFIGFQHYRRFFLPKDINEVFNGKIVINKEIEGFNEIDVLETAFGLKISNLIVDIFDKSFGKEQVKLHELFIEFMNLNWQYNREMFVCPWYIFDLLMQYLLKILKIAIPHAKLEYDLAVRYRNLSYILECLIGFYFYMIMKCNIYKVHETSCKYFIPKGY
jgi:hypothetical protein